MNFCGKCGSKLDAATGLCPKCDHKKLRRTKKKKNRKFKKAVKKMLIFMVTLIVCASGVIGILFYIRMSDSVSNHIDIPKADTTGFQYYESSEDNIVMDDGVTFVNNEILVYLESEHDKEKLVNYLNAIGGEIVGEITILLEYQILLKENYTYKEMINLVNDFEALDGILRAVPNYAVKSDSAYIPDDKQWKNKWKDVPGGGNWGMEAINAPGAWEYKDQFAEVNIGIIDVMFDAEHEDLRFSSQPIGNAEALEKVKNGELEWNNHGTHVAGIAAAVFDNQRGISGVSVKTNLYGVSTEGFCVEEYTMLQFWKMALAYLIVGENCSVVNISMGYNEIEFNASRGNTAAQKELKNFSDSISDFLEILIDKNYTFVLCIAAGNQNDRYLGDKYYLKDEYDENEYAYYSEKDYKKYLEQNEDLKESTKEERKMIKKRNEFFSRYKKELTIRVENGGRLDCGNVDAKYGVFGAITNEKVKKRIIIVGAVENLGTHREGGILGIGGKTVHNGYKVTNFSQRGKSVDIVAPGKEIESTVRGGYLEDEGTSMASPHVAGVAGLVFSINSSLSGDEVKKIICDSSEGTYGYQGCGLVNARNAVEMALDYTSKNDKKVGDKGNIDIHIPSDETETLQASGERDIVLVLDSSSSMSGTPIEETKTASVKFIDTVLKENARVGIVTYESNAERIADFSSNRETLIRNVENISEGGQTNIEAGLKEAAEMLENSNAKKKMIVLMSDGEPNEGKLDEELAAYAEELKETGTIIYTLGFFENIMVNKAEAQYLMEELASDGCHYEVSKAEDLVFFFGDIADQINGQKYIYIRIACPVDVSVTYGGETLCSSYEEHNFRTEFGTLAFEENREMTSDEAGDPIKVLRLKEGTDYDIQIVGTGRGIMNYTIGFMDESGEYSDLRRFEDVKITRQTVIDTVATVSKTSTLKIDEDGDGKYEKKLRAKENGYGELVTIPVWFYAIIFGQIILFCIIVITVLKICKNRR